MTPVSQINQDDVDAGAVRPIWIVVSQVKSNRVVYFTDDQDYQPPTEGDWYYISTYGGLLPEAMNLRNCWGWRFNGGVFSDAREKPKKTGKELLIESNRKALLRILNEKIDTIRSPHQPDCLQGAAVRQLKWEEAKQYLALDANEADQSQEQLTQFPMLAAVAVARNISVTDAARLVVSKATEAQEVLRESERFREQLKQAIELATSETQLLELREWLIDKVYPALSKSFKYALQNTEPVDLDTPIKEVHRRHEIARLKTQLREAINKKRGPLHSDYIQNDEMRKHKAKLAQFLLSDTGNSTSNVDTGLLQTYAMARNLTLPNAAQLMLDSVTSAGQLLVQTEQIKDTMLARIDAIRSLRDIQQAANQIADIAGQIEFPVKDLQ